MRQTAVEWLVGLLKQNRFVSESQIYIAEKIEKEQQDEFAIQVLEFYHNGLFFIPLKDGEAKEILNYIKKEKGL